MADLTNFAFATVMDIYGLKEINISSKLAALVTAVKAGTEVAAAAYDFKLDSLTISNITQEGPIKEARGGIHNKPLIRHKKTMRLEMEDVVARTATLEHFFGAKVEGTGATTKIAFTDKFPGIVALVGRTYVVDQATGDNVWVTITFNEFYPDGVTEINMEAEGDFGMIAIGGELFPNDCGEYFKIEKATAPSC